MKRNNKKGFTIVELVIVIAVIAILAAVLIPTFSSIVKKSRIASDTTLVRNINTALATEIDKHETAYDAIVTVEENGYSVEKLTPTTADYDIVWDSKLDRFVLLDEEGEEVYPTDGETSEKIALFKIYNEVPALDEQEYSIYLKENDAITTANVKVGLDVGKNKDIVINYASSANDSVIFRTNGGKLNIDASAATVTHIGTADVVYITAVDGESYYLKGSVQSVIIEKGHFVAEAGSSVKVLAVANTATTTDVQLENKGGQIEKAIGGQENVSYGIEVDHIVVEDIEDAATGFALFAGGEGTETNPYVIETAEQFKNIGALYTEKTEDYKYYEVKDEVEIIDAKDLGRINLNGSFNGNGVTFKNANGYIFNKAGTGVADDNKQVVVEDFNVVFVGGMGVVRSCGTADLKFSGVSVSGYMLCDWNAGAFLRYGTANVSDGGFDYTVSFENCASTTEIYSTSNAYSAILVGHPYPGNGTATIKLDAATDEAINGTKLYYTGKDKVAWGNKYYCSNAKVEVYVDGVQTTTNKITNNCFAIDSTKIATKDASGKYVLTTEENTSRVVITLNFQYTLYTDSTYAQNIPESSGVGGILETSIEMGVVGGEQIDVLAKIESVEIVTGASKFDYELKDGKLIIYVLTKNANIDGWVTLNVEQFVEGSNIAANKGSIRVAERIAKNNPDAQWIVK